MPAPPRPILPVSALPPMSLEQQLTYEKLQTEKTKRKLYELLCDAVTLFIKPVNLRGE